METLLTENKITLFQKAHVMVQRIFLTDIYCTSYIYHLLKLMWKEFEKCDKNMSYRNYVSSVVIISYKRKCNYTSYSYII